MVSRAQGEGAWIFLSHSNKDFEKVREIRNELERLGHRPIMFYLKCLEDDDGSLPELLRREIAAREWFILCDSPNAQGSRYVLEEVELIKSMEGKVFEVIDLCKELQTELYKLIRISKRATVFISYAAPDHEVAQRIRQALLGFDYRVWNAPDDLSPGSDWAVEILRHIEEAARQGFVLLLLSPAAMKSVHFEREVIYSVQQSKRMNILPVIVAPYERGEMPSTLRYMLGTIEHFDITTGPFEVRVKELVLRLREREIV